MTISTTGRRAARAAFAALAAAAAWTTFATATANASTENGYPTALVEHAASTRTLPYVSNDTYWGYALDEQSSDARQTVSVTCWFDGDAATGTYTTDRWFKVLVAESHDGYNDPRWLFIHASYVYNQPVVRQCEKSSTGLW